MKNLFYILNGKTVNYEIAKEKMTEKMQDRISKKLLDYGIVNERYVLKNGETLVIISNMDYL